MATVTVTQETFPETVKQGTVVLDFWPGWCGPYRAFAPVFETTSRRHTDVVFGKVDTEAEAGLAAAFDIRAIRDAHDDPRWRAAARLSWRDAGRAPR